MSQPMHEIRDVAPEDWARIGGLWVKVRMLDDPLLRRDLHRVTVHRDSRWNAWVYVDGNNGGVQFQSTPPVQGA